MVNYNFLTCVKSKSTSVLPDAFLYYFNFSSKPLSFSLFEKQNNMRAAVIALVAALLCVVAITVDAYTYRVYRGSSDCTLGSGKSVRYYFGSIGQCLRMNSTASNKYEYTKVLKCNSTSKKYDAEWYDTNSACSGTPSRTYTRDVGRCYEVTKNSGAPTNPRSSYRVSCSAGSVAFTAIVAILAFLAFLF